MTICKCHLDTIAVPDGDRQVCHICRKPHRLKGDPITARDIARIFGVPRRLLEHHPLPWQRDFLAKVRRPDGSLRRVLAHRRETRPMNSPGSTAKHVIITPVCRTNRTPAGAFEEAVRLLREEYEACLPGNPDARFHLVLSIERPS